jgi:alpha-ketoglutarate-dependent 2,4-dichlorophenoxyacetate dioxygenase
MSGLSTSPIFNHISIKNLHPTFGAEISGVDFSQPVPQEVFNEILTAITQVGPAQNKIA